MGAEEGQKSAAATSILFNEEGHDEDDESSSEEADEDEEALIPKPLGLPLQPVQNEDVFEDDDDEEEDGEEEEDEEDEEEEEEEEEVSGLVSVAVPGIPQRSYSGAAEPKQCKIEQPSPIRVEEKKPPAVDESRKLFQRLWTDEDEIELLRGFLDYTTQRGTVQHHHHDTALFYDQIKGKLQLEFNKNQLVEKLRRLKKKYRNAVGRINSGKDFSFKSAHDQITFEIARKIWTDAGCVPSVAEDTNTLEEDDANPSPIPKANPNSSANLSICFHNYDGVDGYGNNSAEKNASRSRKRARVTSPEKKPAISINAQSGSHISSLVEETIRSCLPSLLKEQLQTAVPGPGPGGIPGFGGVAALNPMPLNFGGPPMLNLAGVDMVDERWRKQQILELEVYAKRLELVQDQVKMVLEGLRSKGSS